MKKRYKKFIVSLVVVLLIGLSGPGVFGAGKYEGITLNVLCPTADMATVWKEDAPIWAKEHGVRLKVTEAAFEMLYDKLMAELITGGASYDIIEFAPFWAGDIMGGGFLYSLDEFMAKNDPDWSDYLPAFRECLSQWEGKTYSLQIDGDIFVLGYRKDLFEDPSEQAKFMAQYKYELRPPKTWDQYLDIAEFFTRDTDGDGKLDFWGTADIARAGSAGVWHFFARYASYLESPYVYTGGIYFDPDTMEPLINTPAAVKGLENLVASVKPKRSPPGVLGYDFTECFQDFIRGKIAMMFAWPDIGPLSIDPERSSIIGKAAFATLPGADRVWNFETKQWEEALGIHVVSPLAWGWCLGIPVGSQHKQAAYDLMAWMVTGDRAIKQAIGPYDGIDPYRKSQFESQKVKEAFKQIPSFLPALKANILQGSPDLRIPGSKEYYDAVGIAISEALTGMKTPQEALDDLAEKWNKITKERGWETQKALYRGSLGLTP